MKKFIYLIFALMLSAFCEAKVITVNNNVNAIGMFTTLQAAVDAAFLNDTILLHGSATSYGNATINKKLTLIGEGYFNSTDGKAKITSVGNITLDSIAGGSLVSGTVFEGLTSSYLPYSAGTYAIHRCVIKNCFATAYIMVKGNDWEIIDSKCGSYLTVDVPTGFKVSNITIHNSIIGYIQYLYGGLISNCIFTHFYNNNISFLQFQNCIFTNTNDAFSYSPTTISDIALLNCSFANAQPIDASRNITATNCFFSNDPRFVNNTDYQLKPDGPTQGSSNVLKNAGSDGKDIGISGGTYPIKKLDGRVNLPQVYQLIVKTGVIAPGDVLTIDVIGRTRK